MRLFICLVLVVGLAACGQHASTEQTVEQPSFRFFKGPLWGHDTLAVWYEDDSLGEWGGNIRQVALFAVGSRELCLEYTYERIEMDGGIDHAVVQKKRVASTPFMHATLQLAISQLQDQILHSPNQGFQMGATGYVSVSDGSLSMVKYGIDQWPAFEELLEAIHTAPAHDK